MSTLSIVIPAYNAELYLGQTLDSILRSRVRSQVIIVDDASTDGTAALCQGYAANHRNITLIRCPENVGAGQARNIGMKHIDGDYVYFLDSDDIMVGDALERSVAIMEREKCDVLTFKYGYKTAETDSVAGMLPKDLKIWDSITTRSREVKAVSLADHPRLLLTVNYPWNKIVRRGFIEETGLGFSRTYVNNDIYAHWHIYLHAKKICLYNDTLISHRVFEKRQQITNVFDRRRFDIFQALGDVEALLARNEAMSHRFYHHYLEFKLDLLKWVSNRMREDLRDEFLDRVRQSYMPMHQGLFLQAFELAPGVATDSALLRRYPSLVLKK